MGRSIVGKDFRIRRAALVLLALGLIACSPLVSDLKERRNPHVAVLHEQLSTAIHEAGFSHGIRSIRDDDREIDTIFVAIPLDSLRRRHIALHQMLFNVARICARPEFTNVSIQIELNATDAKDREYLSKLVVPIVADARNVKVLLQSEGESDMVVTLSQRPGRASP